METMNSERYGKVTGKKALIMYATLTGNSEKIAKTFEKVLLHYGFEVDVHKAVDAVTPVKITGYDLYIVGTGIVAGLPEKNLLGAFGAGNYTNMRQTAEIGGDIGAPQWGRGVPLAKGIIFFTYGGNRRGPCEIVAASSMLEMMMADMGIVCMGRFACPGIVDPSKRRSHNQRDDLAQALNTSVEEVSAILELAAEDMNAPEIKALPEKVQELLKKALSEHQKQDKRLRGKPRVWHNEKIARPSERDLVKAEIFMSEFVEDVFLPAEAESIETRYECIC